LLEKKITRNRVDSDLFIPILTAEKGCAVRLSAVNCGQRRWRSGRKADMQFTKAEEYGVFGVLYLAETDRSRIVPLSEISQAKDIPEKFLAKIFQSLSKNGVIRSHRGVRGGFSLAKEPTEISLKEVLETIQGPYHLMRCTEDKRACMKDPDEFCAIREVLCLAEKKLVSVFEEITLADLVQWQKAERPPIKALSL
jgi:Rrf2 family iron-sulfur cluster assembly transcriptional regulator